MKPRDIEPYEVNSMGDLADLIAQHAKFATSPLIAKLFNEGASRIENLEIEAKAGSITRGGKRVALQGQDAGTSAVTVPESIVAAFGQALAPLKEANLKALETDDVDGGKRWERISSAIRLNRNDLLEQLAGFLDAAPLPPPPPTPAFHPQMQLTHVVAAPLTAHFRRK